MKKGLLHVTLSCALLLTGCSGSGVRRLEPTAAPEPVGASASEDLDRAAADFGLELLRQAREEGENTFLSPLSVLLCLAMTANGAEGDTLAEFQDILAGGGELDGLNANCASLLEDYGALEGGASLSIAGSLWLDGRMEVRDAFVGRCRETYGAECFSADFTAAAAKEEINRWVEKRTGGSVRQAVDEIDPETVLMLVNAVYFEGKWEEKFVPENTLEDCEFHLENGSVAPVALMGGERPAVYLDTGREQGVLLPYRDGRLAFLALMPAEGVSLSEYLGGLDGARLEELMASAERGEVTLHLPRFTMDWRGSLIPALERMGLKRAFGPGADLSGMGAGSGGASLFVSAVEHGAGIRVDEQGTRAYGFTAVGVAPTALRETVRLTFDRPFVCGVVDPERGLPLFLGTFEKP